MKYSMTAYVLSASTALAHSGHDEAVVMGDTHWLTMGDHLIVVVLAVSGFALGLRELLRKRTARKQART